MPASSFELGEESLEDADAEFVGLAVAEDRSGRRTEEDWDPLADEDLEVELALAVPFMVELAEREPVSSALFLWFCGRGSQLRGRGEREESWRTKYITAAMMI